MWELNNGKIPEGCCIHHKDENTLNNDISNLELKKAGKHMSEHLQKRDVEEQRRRMDHARAFAPKWHGSKDGKEFHKLLGKRAWENKATFKVKCLFCGKEVDAYFKTRKFCDDKTCGNKYRRMQKREGI
ncbi:MAG: HNH endonuclease [Deltaproteobacteria bacterium]|nr:MAG: HNH endonuclease [Deltaproteobacteria bacterium]